MDNAREPAEHSEKSTISRSPKDRNHPYVVILKEFLYDKRLSLKCKGLLTFMLSKPDNWTTYVYKVAEELGVSKDVVYSGFAELERYGYMTKERIRKERNRFDGWEYFFWESPGLRGASSEISIFPNGQNPDTENPSLLNTDSLPNNDHSEGGPPPQPKRQTVLKTHTADSTHPVHGVPINQARYNNLCAEYGQTIVDSTIQKRLDWEATNGKRPALDYAAAIANWIAKDVADLKAKPLTQQTTSYRPRPAQIDTDMRELVHRNAARFAVA